ncbi:hypothetical protein [Nonomuraea endophytica]|uniref:hypothetical protein n=1 Tax=Nonomuraea endophytica TaxID=714136 RepID=UPI0037C9E040
MPAPLYPQVIVECQFTEPAWTDISDWARNITIKQAVSRVEGPIPRYDSGTATLVLDNRDRRFDPTHLDGPYVESGGGSDSGIQQFTCEFTQYFGLGLTIDIKSATGLQAEVVNVSAKASGTTGSFTAGKPSGTLSGHRLIAVHLCDTGTLAEMGTPTGGASWGTAIHTRSEGDDSLQLKVWAKTAGGSEPATYGFTQNSGADGVVFIIAIRNFDAASSEIVASQSNPEAAVFGTPSTTPHAANDLELRIAGGTAGNAGGATWTPPPLADGWTEWADTQSQTYVTASLAAKELTALGTGTATRVKPGRPIRVRASLALTAATNLIQNPSFEVDLTGWSASAGGAIARVSSISRIGGYACEIRRLATNPPFFLYSAKATGTAAGATTGETVTLSAYVYIPAAAFPGVSGIMLGAVGTTFAFVSTAGLAADAWYRISRTVVLSGNLDDVEVQIWTNDSHADGQVVAYVDAVQAEEAAAASPYCDGTQPACSWTGTAHNSSSSRPGSFTWDLFRGFAEDWLLDWEGDYESEIVVPCIDALGQLATDDRAAVAAVGAGEDSGARVTRILNSLGWPIGDRLIGVGNSTLQATTLDGSGLAELQLVADTEIGELYQDGAGRVVFRNRQAILTDERSTTVQARFGGATDQLPYHKVGISYEQQQVANSVRITRVGGAAAQVAFDAAAIADAHATRTYERTDLIMQSDAEALSYAQLVLAMVKEPELRFNELELRPQKAPEQLFPQVLGRQVGDRIQVEGHPPGGGQSVIREVFVRGIEHEIRGKPGNQPRWQTRWVLQSATRAGNFWTLGHPELGKVDSNGLVY